MNTLLKGLAYRNYGRMIHLALIIHALPLDAIALERRA